MTAVEMSEKIQDGVLKAVETSQKWTLGALRSTSSAFDTFKPDPSLLPFAEKAPKPAEAIDSAFAFWGKLLDAQHAFLSGVVEIYGKPAVRATPTKRA